MAVEGAVKMGVRICMAKIPPTTPDSVHKTQHAFAFLFSVNATYLYFCVWKSRIIYLTIKKKF